MYPGNLAIWRMNVWCSDVQHKIIEIYWSVSNVLATMKNMQWLKEWEMTFFCCSSSCANWYLGFQNPFGNKWVSFVSAVGCWTTYIVFCISAIDRKCGLKSSEVWGCLLFFFFFWKLLSARRHFVWSLWYLVNTNGILIFPNLIIQGIINSTPSDFRVCKCTFVANTFIQEKSSSHVLENEMFIMSTG